MKKIGQKLKSNSGVTIVMALLFLAAATMVSVVVISAANTATRNLMLEKKRQQTYLSVSSAAEYVAKQMENMDVQRRVNETSPSYDGKLMSRSSLWPFLENAFEMASSYGGSKETTFTLMLSEDDELLKPTDCTLKLSASHGESGSGSLEVLAKFSLHHGEGAEADEASDYHLTMRISGYYIKSLINTDFLGEEPEESDYITTFSFGEAKISKGWPTT